MYPNFKQSETLYSFDKALIEHAYPRWKMNVTRRTDDAIEEDIVDRYNQVIGIRKKTKSTNDEPGNRKKGRR